MFKLSAVAAVMRPLCCAALVCLHWSEEAAEVKGKASPVHRHSDSHSVSRRYLGLVPLGGDPEEDLGPAAGTASLD